MDERKNAKKEKERKERKHRQILRNKKRMIVLVVFNGISNLVII